MDACFLDKCLTMMCLPPKQQHFFFLLLEGFKILLCNLGRQKTLQMGEEKRKELKKIYFLTQVG